MAIYLLLKQHRITKLQYLCKKTTNNVCRCFTYKGSGKRWLSHLNKHGVLINTAILEVCTTKEEFKQKVLKYNNVWKVGNNPAFANLKPEEGDGGNTWCNSNDVNRRIKLSKSLIKFNATEHGKNIRTKCGKNTRIRQQGKSMRERINNSMYVDPRKGKKTEEIYKPGYTHPQQKPFVITHIESGNEWICNNERDFSQKLKLYADPWLRNLKRLGTVYIKHVKPTTTHNFNKGDTLTFRYLYL